MFEIEDQSDTAFAYTEVIQHLSAFMIGNAVNHFGIHDDGIEDEKKALQIDPDYENAMAYMNLLLRYRADLNDTKEQYQADAKEADEWVQKALETTKKKAAKKSAAAEQTQ